MKTPVLLFFLLFCLFACADREKAKAPAAPDLWTQLSGSPAYDSLLAAKTGADAYGMKQYVMAFLKPGPNRSQDSVMAANLQKAHLENIGRMAEAGKLVVAGPFMDDFEVRGIYIFDVKTVEEAQALTATDPAIQAGRLVMELHPWYGSAAVSLITPLHKKMEKKNVAE